MSESIIPERFGKYIVKAVAGQGAMGTVYRAFDPDIKREVAIKTIRWEMLPDGAQRAAIEARFRNEARAAGRLSHAGIVAVFQFGQTDECAFIAMEYVEGCSLREYLARWTVFTEADVVSVMVQLLNALAHAHEHHVWHRDIKPANLIIMRDGRLKVADFGIAWVESADFTQNYTLMGTPGYMPPEVYLSAPLDHRADVFAAGAVMYELLAGRPAFEGTAEAKMRLVCSERPPTLSGNGNAGRWERYDPLVCKALAKAPSDRFESATAFRDAILAAHSRPANLTISEETVLARPTHGWSRDRSDDSETPAAGAASTSTRWPPGWDPTTLGLVEAQLARIIGPVARVFVQRAARECTELDALVNSIAAGLDEPAEQRAFRAGIETHSAQMGSGRAPAHSISQPGPKGAETGPKHSHLSAEQIESVSRLLTKYIGPLARVIVKSASQQASDREQFYQLLTEHISSNSDREGFLRDARRAEANAQR